MSIIVASCGRDTLPRALESISSQMHPGDELLLSVNQTAPWGHAARNRLMDRAACQMCAFMDDDDIYLPGALQAIRTKVGFDTTRMHIFRMAYQDGHTIWQEPVLEEGQVSTQTIVVPAHPMRHGCFTDRYAGDFDMARTTAQVSGEPAWHEDVIALYRA